MTGRCPRCGSDTGAAARCPGCGMGLTAFARWGRNVVLVTLAVLLLAWVVTLVVSHKMAPRVPQAPIVKPTP